MSRLDVSFEEAIEQIDVGGPAMLRAAAKNHEHVVPSAGRRTTSRCSRSFGCERRSPTADAARRSRPARSRRPPAYDAAVARWLGRDEHFPETFVPVFDRVAELSYGENPHQRAAYYVQRGVAHAPARARRAGAREATLLQQPQRPLGRPDARAGARPAGVRDREARQSLRRRARRDDRRGVRQGARGGSGLRVRRSRRPQPAGRRGAREGTGRAVRRGPVRAGIRRGRRSTRWRRSRRGCSSTASGEASSPSERDLKRRVRRPARPGPRCRRRPARRDGRRLR